MGAFCWRARHLGKQLATKLRKHKAHLERQRDALQAKVERIAALLRSDSWKRRRPGAVKKDTVSYVLAFGTIDLSYWSPRSFRPHPKAIGSSRTIG